MNARPWIDCARQDRHKALIAIGSTVRPLVSSLILIILVSAQAFGQNSDTVLGGQSYVEVRDVVNPSVIGLRDEVAKGCGSSAFFERTQNGDWVLRAPDIEVSARIDDVLTDDETDLAAGFLEGLSSGKMSIRNFIDLGYSGSGTPPPCTSDADAAWMIVFLKPSDQAGTDLLAEIEKGCDSTAFFERTTNDEWVIRAPAFAYTGAFDDLVGAKWRESLPETLEAIKTDSGTILLRDWINRRLTQSDEQPFCSE